MNDTADPPVETRLRATLRAVAHAEPVTGDLDDLRRRSSEVTIPWSDPGRGPRSRGVLAAAVLVVVALAAAGAVVVLTRDDTEPVITDDPAPTPATGFVLPAGLAPGWELVGVAVEPVSPEPGLVRVASFESAEPPLGDTSDGTIQVDAEVSRVSSSPVASRPGSQPMARGAGDDARTYAVWTDADVSGRLTEASVQATVGDLALTLVANGVAEIEPLLELVDRWWESDGEVLVLDPSLGLRRTVDWTYPTATAADPAPSDDGSSEPDTGLVQLVLRAPSGRIAGLTLSVPGAVPRPTGVDDPDGGAAAGLAEDEHPRRVEAPRLGPAAWVWDQGTPLVAVELATVVVGLSGLREDSSTAPVPPGSAPADLDELLALLDALEPVDAARWADTVGPLDGGPDAVAADLASVFRSPDGPSAPEGTPGG